MLEGKKISELDQVNTLSLGSSFPVLDKGATKRIAFSALLNKIENELPESDIDKVKDDVEKLKVKTESINTLTTEMEAVKDQASGVNEMVQGQNATIRNCVSAVEGLEQVIEQTHFDDVLALEEQVHANTAKVNAIESVIPAQTSEENKLADKNFVNNSFEAKQDALNEEQLAAVNSGITEQKVARYDGMTFPVGTILSGLYTTAPDGFLLCNGQEIAQADYPELYAVIGSLECCQSGNAGMFKVPDLREVTLVGAGQNGILSITEHDVYNIGEFKDDQMQGHRHTVNAFLYKQGTNGPAGSYFDYGEIESSDPINDSVNGTPRIGSTTHGKQFGVNVVIKY